LDKADQTPHLFTDTVTLLLTENDPRVLFARRHTRCVKGHEVANVEGIQCSSMQTRVFKMLYVRCLYQAGIKSRYHVEATHAEGPHQIAVHGVFVKVQANLH